MGSPREGSIADALFTLLNLLQVNGQMDGLHSTLTTALFLAAAGSCFKRKTSKISPAQQQNKKQTRLQTSWWRQRSSWSARYFPQELAEIETKLYHLTIINILSSSALQYNFKKRALWLYFSIYIDANTTDRHVVQKLLNKSKLSSHILHNPLCTTTQWPRKIFVYKGNFAA